MSASLEAEHQVILFTSMIAPELEANPNLLIGRSYTHNNKTLQF
jgi:hypothetical protein